MSTEFETAKIPNWIPKDLVPWAILYAKETKRNKIWYAIFFLAFFAMVVQFCFDSFRPGQYMLARQLLFLPLVIVDGLCIRRVVKVGIRAGMVPYLFLFLSLLSIGDLRAKGLNGVFDDIVVYPILFGVLWYWGMSQTKKPPVQ